MGSHDRSLRVDQVVQGVTKLLASRNARDDIVLYHFRGNRRLSVHSFVSRSLLHAQVHGDALSEVHCVREHSLLLIVGKRRRLLV